MNMKTILVTGGAGFVGSNLCRRLVKDPDTQVICLDNLHTGRLENLTTLRNLPNFSFLEMSVLDDLSSLDEYPIAEIYHLACPASPPAYQKDPIYTIKVGTIGTTNILDLAVRHDARMVYTSTSEIYGEPAVHPQKEEYRGNVSCTGPRACYDESKRIGETLCFEYHRLWNVAVSVARLFNTYGPRMAANDGRVVTNFITQALADQNLTVYGDGSQTRSLCYIDDTVTGLVRLMQSGIIGPVNLGNPAEITIKQLAETIRTLTGSNSNIVYRELPQDDPTRRCPDISKAKKLLAWEPTIDLKTGLLKTINYLGK